MNHIEIGKRLKESRKLLNLNTLEMVKIAEVSQSQLSAAETGKQPLSANFIFSLSEKLGINIDWLLTGNGYWKSKNNDEEKKHLLDIITKNNLIDVLVKYDSLPDDIKNQLNSLIITLVNHCNGND